MEGAGSIIARLRQVDDNNDGVIHRRELVALFGSALEPALDQFDTNGDGRIRYIDFVEWAFSGPELMAEADAAAPSELRRQAICAGAIEDEVDNACEQPNMRQAFFALIKAKEAEQAVADHQVADAAAGAEEDQLMLEAQAALAIVGTVKNKEPQFNDVVLWTVDHKYTGTKMPNGDAVTIMHTIADEYKVVWHSQEGWVKKHHIQVQQRRSGIAKQAEGHPEVVLREMPTRGRIRAMVPNGDRLYILESEEDSVKVQWKTVQGWAKAANVQECMAEAPGDGGADEGPLEASARELVQYARSVMEECMQDTLVIGVPKYTQPESIWEILDRTTQPVKLLRCSWVKQYASSDGQQKGLPRRQDLERTVATEAFLPRPEAECKEVCDYGIKNCFNIVSISYCWRAAKHPDADGQQLRAVASKLDQLLLNQIFCRYFTDAGIFWDFCSLYQKDEHNRRTPDEQRAFLEALEDMGIWYLHAMVMTYIVNVNVANEPGINYETRGWTHFERSCAELLKPGFAGSGTEGRGLWPMITEFNASRRNLPLAPEMFAEQLANRHFTNRGDKKTVVRLYTKSCMEALRGMKELALDSVKVQQHDGKRLASVLRHCCSLTVLVLESMDMDDAEVQDIAGVLPNVPSLRLLDLCGNHIGDAGATAISAALPSVPSLKWLFLGDNQIGDAGATAISAALPSMPSLERLDLNMNQIGDAGATAISAALPGMSEKFKELYFGDNSLTAVGKRPLKLAWEAAGKDSQNLQLPAE